MSVGTTLAHSAIQRLHQALEIMETLEEHYDKENFWDMKVRVSDLIADLEDWIQAQRPPAPYANEL